MRLADLFEFRVKNEEILAGMSEEEFREKAKLPILKLRMFCKKVKGKFIAHDPLSATCYLPEDEVVDLVRIARTIGGLSKGELSVDIFTRKGWLPSEYVEFHPREGAVVEIHSEALKGAEFARIGSGGGEIRGKLKVKSISVKTDPSETLIRIVLL